MNVEYSIGTLSDEDENDWRALADILGGSDHPVVQSIIRHLITLSPLDPTSSKADTSTAIIPPIIDSSMFRRSARMIGTVKGSIFSRLI